MATFHNRKVGGRLVKMVPVREQCKTLDNASGFWCTRRKGHDGNTHQHRSAIGDLLAEWNAPHFTLDLVRDHISQFEMTLATPMPESVKRPVAAHLDTLRKIEKWWE